MRATSPIGPVRVRTVAAKGIERIIAFHFAQLERSTLRCEPPVRHPQRVGCAWCASLSVALCGLDPIEQHLFVISSHAELDLSVLHPGQGIGASRSAIDKVAERGSRPEGSTGRISKRSGRHEPG